MRRSFAALFLFVSVVSAESIGEPCTTLIIGDGISTVYPIEHGFLVPGTDTVYVSGVRLDSSEYVLDYNTGSLVFWRRPERWVPIRVVCRCVTLPGMPKEYRLHELPIPGSQLPIAESESTTAGKAPSAAAESTSLDLSGSKTLGVSFGGENAGIDQATRVKITGAVEGVTVEAELSDQSSPIPAEGTTRDIEDLDKLLISLRGRQWRGSFGDVDMRLPAGSFGAIERKAVGATAEWGAGSPETRSDDAMPQ